MTTRKEKATKILAALQEKNPNPASELDFATPWQLLVAVILSAQSTDKQVNKVTANLFAKYPTPIDLAKLSPDQLATEIKSLGLFRNKAKHLVGAAQAVLSEHQGEVPNTMAKLQTLPGVGRKTANVVLSNAFGIPTIAVDTHVFRVANRLGLAKGKTPDQVEKQLSRAIPRALWGDAHHWLILHGRYICVARKPRCLDCPISQWCSYFQQNQQTTQKK